MMFGEVDTDALSPQCGEEGQPICPIGSWIIPLTWAVYMMVANILIVNVLIAVFNGIYSEVDGIALELWMFQRFTFVMEFEQKPLLPPPFIVLCHLYSIAKCVWDQCLLCICEETLDVKGMEFEDGPRIIVGDDHSLKTFLTSAEANQIFDFEEDSLDTLNPGDSSIQYRLGEMPGPMDKNESQHPLFESGHLDNKGIQQLRTSFRDLYTEMESHREKLDKLITYWETSCAIKEINPEMSDNIQETLIPNIDRELFRVQTVSESTSTHASDVVAKGGVVRYSRPT